MVALPPSPAPESKRAEESSIWASIWFGIAFLIFSALIFTLTVHTQPVTTPMASPVANTMPTLPLHYPATRTTADADVHFGTKVADPYRWLEDGQAPEVQAWLTAQNRLTRSYLDALPGRTELKKRYGELLHIDTISAPDRAGDRFFYMKRKATDQKSILYWRNVNEPAELEHVLVDPNQFIGKDNAALGAASPSLDGKLLAYTLKPNNADEATLYVKDVSTGKDLPGEVIAGAKYAGPSSTANGSGFVYTYLPPAEHDQLADRPGLAVVRYHRLGTNPKNDPVIHGKTGDSTKFIGASISRDGQWIFFSQQNGWGKNDLCYQPLTGEPSSELADRWMPLAVGKPFVYSLQAWKGQAYILTNEDAPRYRLFKVGLNHPQRELWREIIPESPTLVLQGAPIVGDHLVVESLENVTSQLEIRDLEGKPMRKIELPGLGSISALAGEPEHEDLYYGFANFTTPPEIFQTTVTRLAQTLWAQVKIPVDPSPYVVEQQFFTSKDGTHVPMFIIHRKIMPMDGSTPFLIYGYGGFGLSQTPFFSPGYYPWLEAGGGYALVNLRGGGEFGEQWHQQGMLLKKQNVFDDCIAAAEYLIGHGYTKAEHLGVRGGSNGGLLVGAMVSQRPDLFRAAVCEAPLLDMIRYVKFGSGKTWIPEYGSPEKEADFRALYTYSPYHHVEKGREYPSVLFCTPANDDRVDPMHARKMAAALQAAAGSSNPILVRVETESGHGGGDQVNKTIDYATDIWGFLMHELRTRGRESSTQATEGK